MTSSTGSHTRFLTHPFIYIAAVDEFRCPANERAVKRFTTLEGEQAIDVYWSSACTQCSIKGRCTTSKYRRIRRWQHEYVLDSMQERLDRRPEMMRVRRQTVEHPFGTIKHWMGSTHFLTKTLPRVQAEMSLHVLAYNLKRVIRIIGTEQMLRIMRA